MRVGIDADTGVESIRLPGGSSETASAERGVWSAPTPSREARFQTRLLDKVQVARLEQNMRERTSDSPRTITLLHIVGARPNYMKIAPIVLAGERWNQTVAFRVDGTTGVADPEPRSAIRFTQLLVHTGQHYDRELCDLLFEDLGLREPDHSLGVGAASPITQTARVMERLEPLLNSLRPDVVLVPGDVNSSMAAALACVKLRIPVAHVEAGVRSYDREMPEEHNRVVIDHVADILYAPCSEAVDNLLGEGIPAERITFVGNTMIDTLDRLLPAALAREGSVRQAVRLASDEPFILVTLHRPSNVDDPIQLGRLLDAFAKVAEHLPVVFPVHPRTRARMGGFGLANGKTASLRMVQPLGYLDFLALMRSASAVMTDSGGVQAETTRLGVPCVTLRTTTEWPATLRLGTAVLVDPFDVETIVATTLERARPTRSESTLPPVELWDGAAGDRLVHDLADRLSR